MLYISHYNKKDLSKAIKGRDIEWFGDGEIVLQLFIVGVSIS